jgi:O-antigen/teichoic acid export membrane protein
MVVGRLGSPFQDMSTVSRTAQVFGAHLLVLIQGLILTPIVLKVAGPEVYGAYLLALSYLGIMFGVSSLGVGATSRRKLPGFDAADDRARLFFPPFTFHLAVVFGVSILSMLAYEVGHASGILHLSGFSSWMIPAYLVAYVLYSQTTDYFRFTHRLGIFNTATVAQPYLFIGIVLTIYFLTEALNPGTLIFSATIAFLMVAAPQLFLLHKDIGLGFRLSRWQELRAEIRIGFPLILSYVVDVILAGGDRYIIAAILSVRDVGFYVPAYTIGSLALVLPKMFGVVLLPLLSQRVDAGDIAGARRLIEGATRVFLLVSIPFVVGAFLLGESVLRIYATDEIAREAWPVIPLVAFGMVFYGLVLLNINLLFIRLRTGVMFRINAGLAVLNIVLNAVLLKLFAHVAVAAIATLVSYFISYVWLMRNLRDDELTVPIDLVWLAKLVVAAFAMGGAILLMGNAVKSSGIFALLTGMATGIAVFAVIIHLLKLADAEMLLLRSGLRRAR